MKCCSAIVLIVAICHLSGQTFARDKKRCQKMIDDVDAVVKNFMFMSKNLLIPKNSSLMNDYCRTMMPLSKKASQYASQCEKSFVRQVASIFAASIRKPASHVCRRHKQESIDTFSCFSATFEQTLRILPATLLRNLKQMADNSSTEEIIPMFCCSFAVNLQGVRQLQVPVCKNGSIDLRDFIHNQVSSVVSDILDLMCGSFKTIQACEEKVPQSMAIITHKLEPDFDPDQTPFVGTILKTFARLSQ